MGAEVFGGLGDTHDLSTHNTSHYAAPVFAWQFASHANMRISPAFGLNNQSHRVLTRFSLTYEIEGFASKVKRMFR